MEMDIRYDPATPTPTLDMGEKRHPTLLGWAHILGLRGKHILPWVR
jgi:hypothetical protein